MARHMRVCPAKVGRSASRALGGAPDLLHCPLMAPLGALSQAWVSAEASLLLGWQIVGLWRFGEVWVSLAEGPAG